VPPARAPPDIELTADKYAVFRHLPILITISRNL